MIWSTRRSRTLKFEACTPYKAPRPPPGSGDPWIPTPPAGGSPTTETTTTALPEHDVYDGLRHTAAEETTRKGGATRAKPVPGSAGGFSSLKGER